MCDQPNWGSNPRILLLVLLPTFCLVYGKFSKGLVTFELERAIRCENYPPVDMLELAWNKCNKTNKCASIRLNVTEEVGAKSSLDLYASKWGAGGWMPNALNFRVTDVCRSLDKVFGKLWTDVREQMKMGCPIKEGIYSVSSFYSSQYLPSNFALSLLSGKFKVRFIFKNDGKILLCRDFIFDISEKVN